jgi:Cys-tRNA(Pro)/Cys-tRNA(Cys) deacylase
MPAKGTPAIDLLRKAGVAFEIHSYELPDHHGHDSYERPRYGRDAAAALGVDPARMFKTLIATVDGRLVAAVVPVDRDLDLKRLATALGARRASLADPAEAERATGYVVGGISPLGGRRRMPTLIDRSAMDHPTVYVSAGRRGVQLSIAPDDLVRVSGATLVAIARDGGADPNVRA